MSIPLSFLKKVDADYAAYLELWQDKPFAEVLPKVLEISHIVKLHRCLHKPEFTPCTEYITYLNRFQNPLAILLAHREQYYWDDTEEVLRLILSDVCRSAYADVNGYALDKTIP